MKKLLLLPILFYSTGIFAQDSTKTAGMLFSEAVEMAQQALDSVGVSATILGGETYFGSEMYYDDGPDGQEYGFNGTSLSSRMGELRVNSSSLSLPMVLGEHEHDSTNPGPGMMPMGYSDWWSVYAYDSSLDSVIVMDVSPEGVWDAYMIGEDEVEEEGIDFSLMQTLPETYIDSDSAMILAEGYGGQMFRDEYSVMSEEEFAGWEVNLRAVHEYWSVPDEDPSAVPVMWVAEYYGGKMNMYGMGKLEMFAIYMDITTGDTLFTERYVEEFEPEMPGILFSEAVDYAQQALDSAGVDAVILGGETYFSSYTDEVYPGGEDYAAKRVDLQERLGEYRLREAGPALVMGEHEADSVHPGPGPGPGMLPLGYSNWWSMYAYASDSVMALEVGPEGVMEVYILDAEDTEGIDVSVLKALPETYIDSDSALVLADGYGGQAFRDSYEAMDSQGHSYMEVGMSALHQYWVMEDADPSDVPVMWAVEYYGERVDAFGSGLAELYTIYMDISTGDTLFTERYVEEFEPEMPGILFSEAVEMAQQALDSAGVDAVILGGETYFGSEMYYDDGPDGEEYAAKRIDLEVRLGEYRLREAGPALVMGEHEADSVHPGPGPGPGMLPLGYSNWWSMYAYASDSVMAIEVGPEGVMEVYILDAEDTEGIDVSVLKALPETYIDSDSALVLADGYGGQAFRDTYEVMDSQGHSYLEVGMSALHQYWVMEDADPSDVPVMWAVEYYGERVDAFGSGLAELYTIYMDISTGDTLFTERYVEEFEPEMPGILFSEAVEMAQQALDSAGVDAVILGGETYFGSEMYYDDGPDGEEYAAKRIDLEVRLGEYRLREAGPALVMGEHEADSVHPGPGPGPGMLPLGYSNWWSMYAYASDSVMAIEVGPEGVLEVYILDAEDTEGIDVSVLKALPETYIDSDSALVLADGYGGQAFRDTYEVMDSQGHSYLEVGMSALHQYWVMEDADPSDVPVMWAVEYYGERVDAFGSGLAELYTIYMDISTGDTLFTERYVEEFEPEMPGILFSEAVEMAQQALDSAGVDAVILGGETYFSSNVVGCGAGPESGVCGEYRLREAGPALVMGEHEADSVHPGPGPGPGMLPLGYSNWWSMYAYASDSVMAIEVGPEGVLEVYILDAEDTEGIDVSVLKALPETYIDSDSALVLADGYGGQAFRDTYEVMDSQGHSYLEVGMSALHQYWVMEDADPSDVPVMWAVEYYGERVDAFGSGLAELYTIYMDISTGDTLFTERYVEEFEPEMPGILFSEAVEMAQQALDSAGVDAVILGGETSYDYSTQDLDLSELELEHGIHLMPMGYSEWWNIYAYEPSMDSILVLEVEMDGVWEVYAVGEEDMDESIDFSILKALPEDYMDSNELIMMIAESDYDLENFMTDVTLPDHAYMNFSMDLRIIHDYWSLPIDLAPELIPVTWNMTLHGSLMDSLDQTMMSDSLSVFIHSTEGELLYASLDLTNSEQENTVPEAVVLYQNYPNPFNPSTSISFDINKAQRVRLDVYNLLGQKVATLVNGTLEAGRHNYLFKANSLASGVYIYQLTTDSKTFIHKMTLVK